MNANKIEEEEKLLSQKLKLTSKLDEIERRFVMGEITKVMFDKFSPELSTEIREIDDEIVKCKKSLSNPEKIIKHAVNVGANISKIWERGDFNAKQQLQKIAFPKGISYSRDSDEYRTFKVNALLAITPLIAEDYKNKKTNGIIALSNNSISVDDNGNKSNLELLLEGVSLIENLTF